MRTRSNDREWGRASGGSAGDAGDGDADEEGDDDDEDDDDDDGERGRDNKQVYAETVGDFSEGSRD